MSTLLLVRHGETVWHAEHRYAGSSDVELTDHGRAQADELAEWAARARLSAVVASPLQRARLTAAPSAAATGLDVRIDPRLVEIDFGAGEGLTPGELDERMPAEWAAFERHPARQPMPAGESGVEGVARALPALLELVDEFPHGRVLVVTHATLMRLVLCELLGIDPDRYRELFPVVGNCAPTILRFEELGGERRARLLGFNIPPRP
ncbi:Phosphoserine phosphatase 1 [Agromyces sp. NDB4Y10]|uniref:histidine phosphatase family protein n=1 Tax=Agromyces sp. NDB4Y10 TaxID=1775951 RepID=UPI0007B1DDC5|nr:histidine phosphatase family protein [Agromyces sp. NDB4Y10]KZE93473.1 Phosphoserine phosphatase 1 [Agromyces sp. NDB4Y10]